MGGLNSGRKPWILGWRPLSGAERARRNYAKHPDRGTARKLGVSETFLAELRHKFPVCEVCGRPSLRRNRRLHIDHNHATNAIRGVLCGDCNNALGYVKDSPATLRSLADYLETRANLDLREGIECLLELT